MKPWRDEIRQHIEGWSGRLGDRHWWPRYVYHFTDVCNAASIITTGYLYSRDEAERLELMQVDNASPQIIAQTRPQHKRYARLYFRPRTPTQYRNEGIRPRDQRELGGAHCPIPVYFCFDALEVLAQDDTEFSDGNMGSDWAQHRCDREFFLGIPFRLVFHHGAIPPNSVQDVVFRRNAEVLVPDRLALTPGLSFVACRSAAERQTLLHLLPQGLRSAWAPSSRLGHQGLFERKWTYVEEVLAIGDSVIFAFNPSTKTPGPFQVSFTYTELGSRVAREWHGVGHKLNNRLRFKVPGASRGTAQLRLDDDLAFAGPLIFEDIPF